MEKISDNLLISIIVPIYNVRDYVCKCVESIQNQTYKNLEIILVDDGSTDGCGEICDKYAADDNRIVVIHKVNGGLSDARNYGIDRCHGALLGFVDGDDMIHPQMYEIMLKQLQEIHAEVVTCWFDREDEDKFQKQISEDEVTTKILTGTEALIDIETPLVVAWNKLYKREIFNNLRYPVGRLHEDEFVIHKIFKQCKKVCVIENSLYFYTVRSDSIVANMSEKRIDDSLDAFMDRVKFADENDWTEVMPAVVKRYCDYCIDRYWEIKNHRYQLPSSVMDKLWSSVHDLCERYPEVDIDIKYRKFADAPDTYQKYLDDEIKKHWFKNRVMEFPRKLRRLLKK